MRLDSPAPSDKPLTYRRELDGIRAIAVLAVIAHHGLGAPRGGFLGVDIFFVLSGFLITSIIVGESERGEFRLLRFYERRVRRILPALILVIVATIPFAYLWMLPDELQNYGQSLVATSFSANNVLLAVTTGYWDLDSSFKPFLHTWSLGVEEQYYLIVPFCLALLMNRRSKWLLPGLAGLTAVSLAAAQVLSTSSPQLGFYGLPTRAWELAIGGIAAVILLRRPQVQSWRYAGSASLAGLLMMTLPILVFTGSTPNPSVLTLIPVVGTALVIAFGHDGTSACRVLSMPVMVGIGLLSYSAYLWHQPLFAFARIYSRDTPGVGVMALLTAVTFVLAFLSWRYVERPFRSRQWTSTPFVLGATTVGTAVILAFGMAGHLTSGLPQRISNLSASSLSKTYNAEFNERILDMQVDGFSTGNKRRVLVIGDSFARDLLNSIIETYREDPEWSGLDIAYRNHVHAFCYDSGSEVERSLFDSADAVIVASITYDDCMRTDAARTAGHKKAYVLVGPKSFGSNVNWLMRQVRWKSRTNPVPAATSRLDRSLASEFAPDNYFSWLRALAPADRIEVTDPDGKLTTIDRLHFTEAGAIHAGRIALPGSTVERALFGPRPTGRADTQAITTAGGATPPVRDPRGVPGVTRPHGTPPPTDEHALVPRPGLPSTVLLGGTKAGGIPVEEGLAAVVGPDLPGGDTAVECQLVLERPGDDRACGDSTPRRNDRAGR